MSERRLNYRLFSNIVNLVVMLALVSGIAEFTGRVQAVSNTITVTTSADNIIDGDSFCSLREAITNANDNAATYKDCLAGLGHETIIFDAALGTATITLSSALPIIGDAGLTILGGDKITISGNDLFRVFETLANVPLTLDGLTVTHGMDNTGGGAYTAGGGAYINPGSIVTVLNSTFTNNSGSDIGGAIENFGTLMITNSTFSSNSAVSSGGGVANGGILTITNSTFSGNYAPYGGGVRSYGGGVTITKSIFSGNSADQGGGIYNLTGGLAISTSTFSSNTALAGGGILNIGLLVIANSTFFGNSATSSGISGVGGGVYNTWSGTDLGIASFYNSTFSGNSATISGAGVYNEYEVHLFNTIIANSTHGGDCDNQATANGNSNLIEDPLAACDLANGVSGNIIGSDPALGPGTGSPVYLPLNGNSLAIDAGDNATCAAAPVNNTSQNGLSRPQGAHCDIGAYEADVTPPTVVSILRADPNPTTAASLHFTVTFSEPVYGVSLNDFSMVTTGLSGTAVNSISSSSGTAITVTVSSGSGTGTFRLDLIDRDTILDNANLHLGGDGQNNGNFSSGEVYFVRFLHIYLALVRR